MTQLWAVRRGDRWQLIMASYTLGARSTYREHLIGEPMSEAAALSYLKAHRASAA
jgi:hypothetical protein